MKTQTYILICDLKDTEEAKLGYDECHKAVAPEIIESIREAGVLQMTIYRWENRLTMILVADEEFSFEKKAKMDLANPHVQEWEKFLSNYQTNLPGTPENWRWAPMDKVFDFHA
ncbi:L-rhamnose mutarotase [Algoriphagus winogradskyi]|uniref:L-rhamnose mutarotase n=1 Tax=Algoriphagus winogradskyi TaxID=237017 RepID=A0ABY1NCF6_9BACT|nr:L-rhamnose mutarotase [Algoriphagus winogradskyi]SMP06091.1 L-rhamnose mutarotase [Algoriphagus winogradskyi]|tara:strand:- start:257 stop:598 length:342 start_codon:yes stop_codon:yes gene_type:complete